MLCAHTQAAQHGVGENLKNVAKKVLEQSPPIFVLLFEPPPSTSTVPPCNNVNFLLFYSKEEDEYHTTLSTTFNMRGEPATVDLTRIAVAAIVAAE
jgi:hypothetical protein